jgi:hypothetical protein
VCSGEARDPGESGADLAVAVCTAEAPSFVGRAVGRQQLGPQALQTWTHDQPAGTLPAAESNFQVAQTTARIAASGHRELPAPRFNRGTSPSPTSGLHNGPQRPLSRRGGPSTASDRRSRLVTIRRPAGSQQVLSAPTATRLSVPRIAVAG